MSINLTLPQGLELRDWADQIILDIDNQVVFGKLMDDANWQDWAVQFVGNVGLSRYNPPMPYQFDDWKLWAERFVYTLS
ncbi:MAG: hypothetical protein ACR2IJ_09325 [Fluviibacter sp.]